MHVMAPCSLRPRVVWSIVTSCFRQSLVPRLLYLSHFIGLTISIFCLSFVSPLVLVPYGCPPSLPKIRFFLKIAGMPKRVKELLDVRLFHQLKVCSPPSNLPFLCTVPSISYLLLGTNRVDDNVMRK